MFDMNWSILVYVSLDTYLNIVHPNEQNDIISIICIFMNPHLVCDFTIVYTGIY